MVGVLPSWKELAKPGVVQLDPGLAKQLAGAASDLAGVMLAVKAVVDGISTMEPFVPKLSGADLAKALNDRRTRAGELLDQHVTVLGDMQTAFVNAGKALLGADVRSAADLEAIPRDRSGLLGTANERLDSKIASYRYEISDYSKDNQLEFQLKHTKPADLLKILPPASRYQQGGMRFEGANLTPDYYGLHFGAPELFAMREAGYHNMPIQENAKRWGWVAKTLARESENLLTLMNGIGDRWQGNGRDAAGKAVQIYVGSTIALANETVSMNDGLTNVASWRRVLSHRLSEAGCIGDPSKMEFSKVEQAVKAGQEVIDAIYKPAVLASAAAIPGFTPPETTVKPQDPPGGKQPSPSSPSRGSGTRPGGGVMPRSTLPSIPAGTPSTTPTPNPAMTGNGSGSGDLGALSGLAQQAASAIGAPSAQSPTVNPSGATPSTTPKTMAASANPAAKGTGGASPGGAGAATPAKELGKSTSTFPRAGTYAQLPLTASAVKAASAASSATPGTPGASGAAGRNAGEDNQKRKMPSYLLSEDALDEAVGGPQVVTRAVVEE
ncbi:hypothetical protein ACFVMC_01985 [Nocardia sp. NPDC127579]|uniref:hypothetical protein n=1 Tax=Nocardia sp. NPDC127579 TaxID=3345402 RepID=UPI0036278E52